jgi:hypothetical protein
MESHCHKLKWYACISLVQVLKYKIQIDPQVFDEWFKGRNKHIAITVKTQMYLIDIQNHKKVRLQIAMQVVAGVPNHAYDPTGCRMVRFLCSQGESENAGP